MAGKKEEALIATLVGAIALIASPGFWRDHSVSLLLSRCCVQSTGRRHPAVRDNQSLQRGRAARNQRIWLAFVETESGCAGVARELHGDSDRNCITAIRTQANQRLAAE